MISHRFGLAPLNKRVTYANNIARSFDFDAKPRLELPRLPDPQAVVSQPCAASGNPDVDAAASRAKEHDLLDLVTTGYLDRLGFEFRPARTSDLYREPDKLAKAGSADPRGASSPIAVARNDSRLP
jgi:phospholipase C